MRSGTTALHDVLGRHPDIFMSEVKEPAFLADPAELALDSRVASEAGFAANPSAYLALFRDAGDVPYVGESSTHYTKLPRITGVAARMAAFAPDARILYFVRNPLERALSHYRFAVKRKTERRGMLDAIMADPFYCAVSDYATQLQPYVDTFGLDRIWVGTLEAMAADPGTELERLYDWLGVAHPDDAPRRFPKRNAIADGLAIARGPGTLHRIGKKSVYQRLARSVAPKAARDGIRRVLTRPVNPDELRDPDAMAYLRRTLIPRVAAFETLIGRSFPEWNGSRAP
jgi:hypothetical protein